MVIGIFLSLGESFSTMRRSGQDTRFKKFYLSVFSKNFDKVYVFSYENETITGLPKNVILIPNKYKLNRFLYGFLLPIINFNNVRKCDVIRAYQLSGTVPAIVNKLILKRNFVFNFGYDYELFAKIENKKIQAVFFRILKPIALLFASKIIVCIKPIMRQINSKKSIYIPNGVDTSFFRAFRTKKHKIPTILSVGRLENQKNFHNLIYAISLFKKKVNLIIVGDGPQKNSLIKKANDKKVSLRIIGKVDNLKMPNLYNRADFFILPSVVEGSSKVLLEAMACELPVIGSDIDGVNEIIIDGFNGMLTKTDAQSIKEKISYLIQNKKVALKVSKNARKTIQKSFNLKFLINREIVILKTLASI